jgi:hypothetical protein
MEQFIYETITDKRSIPFNSSGTGTIATHGIAIVGTGTQFTTELRVGSYLVDLSQWEARRVYRVDSDTIAFLEKPFTLDIAALTVPEIVAQHQVKVKEISISTAGTALVNNASFTGSLTLSKASDSRSSRSDLIAPIIVDASGTQMQVSVLY